MKTSESKMLRTEEALEYLKISKAVLWRLRCEKKIHAYKPTGGTMCMYDQKELDEFLHTNRE